MSVLKDDISVASASLHSVEATSCWGRCSCYNEPDYFGKEKRCSSAHFSSEEEFYYVTSVEDEPGGPPPNAFYLPLTFVPDVIIDEVLNDTFRSLPYVLRTKTVLFVADVCNFTSLTEMYSQKGISGIEEIARLLNGYMSTLASMLIAFGGDILNFAGDAFLCQWEDRGAYSDFDLVVQQAYTCAVTIQTHKFFKEKDVERLLQVKIGIAVGDIITRVLGSPSEFLIFLVAGPTVPIVGAAEEMCLAGEIIVSDKVFETLQRRRLETYTTEELKDGFVKITGYPENPVEECYVPDRMQNFSRCDKQHVAMSRAFLIPVIRDVKTRQELNYLSELTMVTILFVLLQNVDTENEDCDVIDQSFGVVLACVKKLGGAINKMLLFDKGCTVLAVFGLPGMKHANDSARALLCAEDLIEKLDRIGLVANIGITSGTCFCGIVGHPQRQEYTVIGSRVNLAARIMTTYCDESIALDTDTFHLSRKELGDDNFTELESRKMKGIDNVGPVYAFKLSSFRKKRTFTLENIQDDIFVEKEKEKARIMYCLTSLKNVENCVALQSKALLPVVTIEGDCGKGKSYLMYYACKAASSMDFKVTACCTIPSYINEPFSTAANIIRYCLKFTFFEGKFEREQKLLKYIPDEDQGQVFLLNHLFHVHFHEPKRVICDKAYRDNETGRLLKIILQQYNMRRQALIAIHNANFMDQDSWRLIKELVEIDHIVLFITVPLNFKEPSFSSSVLLLKSFSRITLGKSVVDFFSSFVCWFMGVAAVHNTAMGFMKKHSKGNSLLLEEILLTESLVNSIDLILLSDIPLARLENEFYVDGWENLTSEEKKLGLACDLKSSVDLSDVPTSENVHDAIKERLNKMNLQDRLLLKRAAVLGMDFDQTTLESVSPEMTCEEVAASINSLIMKDILISVCSLDTYLNVPTSKEPFVLIKVQNTCFCSQVLQRSTLVKLPLMRRISPFHRLEFRDEIFRTCVLGHMTKEQLLSMHLEIADYLKMKGSICMPLNQVETARIDSDSDTSLRKLCSHPVRVPMVDFEMCMYLEKRPRVLALVSSLYKAVGMRYLPLLFLRKAANSSLYNSYPIQALNYIAQAEKYFPGEWCFEHTTTLKEEKHFNPVVLKASVKVIKSESLLLLGNSYEAAAQIFEALDMLGLDSMDLFGALKYNEFTRFLAKCTTLHCETLVKCISAISKAYLMAHEYSAALNLIKIEYIALDAYPISFTRELRHMIAFYECEHKLKHNKSHHSLEMSILKYCHERLRTCNTPLDIMEISTIGCAYVLAIETNLNKEDLSRAEVLANEASIILRCVKDLKTVPHIFSLLAEIYFHQQKYFDCFIALNHMQEVAHDCGSFTYRALLYCGISRLLLPTKKFDIPHKYIDECNGFVKDWRKNYAASLQKDLAFYITARLALWCLSSMNSNVKFMFDSFYNIALKLQQNIIQDTYWHVSAMLLMLRIRAAEGKKETDFETVLQLKQQLQMCGSSYSMDHPFDKWAWETWHGTILTITVIKVFVKQFFCIVY